LLHASKKIEMGKPLRKVLSLSALSVYIRGKIH
jgi:hypothetical protein